jgi:acyl carrier protein
MAMIASAAMIGTTRLGHSLRFTRALKPERLHEIHSSAARYRRIKHSVKIMRQHRSARDRLQLGATSIGVALAFAGCEPAQSPGPNSNARPRAVNSVRVDKTAPVDQRVRAILVEQLGLKIEPKPTDRFVEDLGADSLDCVELVMALEEEFNVEIPDEEAVNLKTLADTVAFIARAQKR